MSWQLLFPILLLSVNSCFSYKPVILIHGVMTGSISMELIKHRIQEKHPATIVYNVNRFESWSSLENMWHQVLEIGQDVANISSHYPDGINVIGFHQVGMTVCIGPRANVPIQLPEFNGTANELTVHLVLGDFRRPWTPDTLEELTGYSQGGLIARGIIQTFENVTVDTFISLSSPQAGQYGAGFLHLVFPGLVKESAFELFYSKVGQHTSVGNYWKDPYHQKLYEKYSVYLPYINNHIPSAKSETFKNNMLKLKRLVLVGGPSDNVITPWQSSQFGYYDGNETVRVMHDQDIYKEDRIGLRTLDKTGRLHLVTVAGVNHFNWHMNVTIVDNCLLPFLN